KTGDSKWISSEESRKYVHNLRHTSDAIMAGVNTVLTDNPRLTARCGSTGGTLKKQPLRVVIDDKGRTPLDAQIFNEPGKVLLAVGNIIEPEKKEALSKAGADVLKLPSQKGLIDLEQLLKTLAEQEITSVLVEGGGISLGSLFDHRLVDKVIIYIAPIIIGGEKAKTAVAGQGVEKVTDAFKLENMKVENFGPDLMISGYVKNT
ncbi:RibD family protein, partial [Chloroflexota bacterium]